MYPFGPGHIYVRNAWYMAAWDTEIGRKPLMRTIMDEPVVFYRTQAGQPVALWGLCAHRYFPLGDAELVGDNIVCPYHGFTYSPDGRCVRIPAQDKTPKNFRMRVYPVVERGRLLWIWMGDAAFADPAKLPPLEEIGMGHADWATVPNGITPVKARWQLLVDNLMDLSHIGFLHLKTLKSPDAGDAMPLHSDGEHVRASRWLLDQSPEIPYYRWAFPDNTDPLDIELGTTFYGTCLIVTWLRFHTSARLGPRQFLGTSNHIHGITPETRHRTHDFSAVIRTVRQDAPDFDAWLRDAVDKTRLEDVEALEKIEPLLDRFADSRTELASISDVSAIRVRRRIAGQMQAEADQKRATAAAPV